MHVLSEILLIPLLELLCMAHKNSILALSLSNKFIWGIPQLKFSVKQYELERSEGT